MKSSDGASEYGCLNVACRSDLRLALTALIMHPIGFLLKLVILSLLSMRIAFKTKEIEHHYKNWFNNVFTGLSLIACTAVGVYFIIELKYKPIETNPDSNWILDPNLKLPVMANNVNMETTNWMPLTVPF
jgi:hypothetical protein